MSTRPMTIDRSAVDTTVPLTVLKRGESGVITHVDEGLEPSVQHRLRLLGFCEGRKVTYVRRAFWFGPMIFQVCDVNMCIRSQQAGRIHVAPST